MKFRKQRNEELWYNEDKNVSIRYNHFSKTYDLHHVKFPGFWFFETLQEAMDYTNKENW